ncbi:MAG: ankyrin repeat domain-containing protein, partial [Leadbetterella sp.]|nr:ankyrin repeat domain-containing protein [Leadbetterella sp.]
GNIDKLNELFSLNKKIAINDAFDKGFTPLHFACRYQQLNVAKYLLENGADPDLPAGGRNRTAFQILQELNSQMFSELESYFQNFLTSQIEKGHPKAHIRLGRYLLNMHPTSEELINRGIDLLIHAGKNLGEVDGYMLLGDYFIGNRTKVNQFERFGMFGSLNLNTILNNALIDISILDKIERPSSDADVFILVAYFFYRESAHKYQNIEAKIRGVTCACELFSRVLSVERCFKLLNLETSQLAEAARYNSEAKYLYAFNFVTGMDVSLSNRAHESNLRSAAFGGCALAQQHYTLLLLDTTLNALIAKYCKMAADHGFASSQFLYAGLCVKGIRVDKNIYTASHYYQMSADLGCKHSANALIGIQETHSVFFRAKIAFNKISSEQYTANLFNMVRSHLTKYPSYNEIVIDQFLEAFLEIL